MSEATQKPRRKDPPRLKRVSNAFDNTRIKDGTTDPNRVYAFASLTARYMGVRSRQGLGWRIELERKDGPKLVVGTSSNDGEPIRLDDCILMSIEREKWEHAQQFGWFGEGGQALLDERDAVIQRKGSIDSLPNMDGFSWRNGPWDGEAQV